MNEKENSGRGLEAFFAGKGFYIVLFLCVAVIGVSAWFMLTGTGTDVEENTGIGDVSDIREPWSNEAAVITEEPAAQFEEPTAPAVGEDASGTEEAEEAAVPEAEPPAAAVWSENEPADYFVWPVNGEIEVPYSVAALIYNRTMADWRTHDGVDIAADMGAQVMAAGSGMVTGVYTDPLYGVTVEITHAGGLVSVYSNLAELPTVQEGDGVMVGEVIGSVGDTALCETGEVCHLHFAMRQDGNSMDPMDYLPER